MEDYYDDIKWKKPKYVNIASKLESWPFKHVHREGKKT